MIIKFVYCLPADCDRLNDCKQFLIISMPWSGSELDILNCIGEQCWYILRLVERLHRNAGNFCEYVEIPFQNIQIVQNYVKIL